MGIDTINIAIPAVTVSAVAVVIIAAGVLALVSMKGNAVIN
jgi:hypothetical protein